MDRGSILDKGNICVITSKIKVTGNFTNVFYILFYDAITERPLNLQLLVVYDIKVISIDVWVTRSRS